VKILSNSAVSFGKARLAISFVFFTNGMGFASVAPHLPWLQNRFQLSESDMGLLLLCHGIGAVSMMLVAGRVIQTFGSRLPVIVGGCLFILLLPLIFLLDQILIIILILIIAGAGIGTMDVAMNAQAVTVENGLDRPIMSSFHGLWSLGAMTGGASATFALSFGFSPLQQVTISSMILAIILGVCSFSMLPSKQEEKGEKTPLLVRPSGKALSLGLLCLLGMVAEGTAVDWSAIYSSSVLGSTSSQAALTFTIFTMTMMIGRLTGDWVIQKVGRTQLVRCTAIFGTVGFSFGLVWGTTLSAWIGFACLGFGLANIVPIMFGAASRIEGVSAGTGIAGVATLGYCGFLLGPPTIGFLAELMGLKGALGLIVLFCLILGIFGPGILEENKIDNSQGKLN
jgi:fucose permease